MRNDLRPPRSEKAQLTLIKNVVSLIVNSTLREKKVPKRYPFGTIATINSSLFQRGTLFSLIIMFMK